MPHSRAGHLRPRLGRPLVPSPAAPHGPEGGGEAGQKPQTGEAAAPSRQLLLSLHGAAPGTSETPRGANGCANKTPPSTPSAPFRFCRKTSTRGRCCPSSRLSRAAGATTCIAPWPLDCLWRKGRRAGAACEALTGHFPTTGGGRRASQWMARSAGGSRRGCRRVSCGCSSTNRPRRRCSNRPTPGCAKKNAGNASTVTVRAAAVFSFSCLPLPLLEFRLFCRLSYGCALAPPSSTMAGAAAISAAAITPPAAGTRFCFFAVGWD